MALPGFTAEDSVGPTLQPYRTAYQAGADPLSLAPQMLGIGDNDDDGTQDGDETDDNDIGENELDDGV
jgi:hypothetical protein